MKLSAIHKNEIADQIKKLNLSRIPEESWIIAMDEVGRGSLFGPVTVAGILFPYKELFSTELPEWCSQVGDSKKIKHALRNELSQRIKQKYIYQVSHISVEYINKYNINGAIKYGVYRTARALIAKGTSLHNKFIVPYIFLDGNYKFIFPQPGMASPIPPVETFIRGDENLFHISCASIIAKEERDELIKKCAPRFAPYGLDKNVGYGTLHHRNALMNFGVTKFHRKEFVKKIVSL